MRRTLKGVGLALVLLLLAAAGLAAHTAWGRPLSIDLFFLRVLARYGLESPILLSTLRVLEPWGIDFHNDELDDFSVEASLRRAAWQRRELAVLRRYQRASLSAPQQRSYDVMEWLLSGAVAGEPFLFHRFPLNQLDGVQSELPDFLLNVHQIGDAEGARDYVARLAALGRALDQAGAAVRHAAGLGIVPPRFVLERVAEQVRALTAPPPEANVLQLHLERSLAGLPHVAPAERERLALEGRRALAEHVYPAYARLDAALAELRPQAGDDAGAWRLPDGEAYYAWALRMHTTSELAASEIHRTGLAETARIQRELRALLAAEGIDAADLRAALRALDADPRFRYPDTEEGRARVLADYRAIVEDAQRRLPALFGQLPRAPVAVERVPPFKEAGAAGAYYRPPPLDGSRPGVFYANLRSVAEISRLGMRTLAYHEAVPGHHLQIALAFENRQLHLFRRVVPFSAFSEGWALYAERLAAESGFHPTTWDRIGALEAELFRAVRLVVDTGLHARRWTREEAIDWMLRNTAMAEGEVVAEVERYVVDPGQACAYKIGQLEILALRERARAALGPRFDLRAFHDVLLGDGSLPLVLLRRQVEAWIAPGAAAGG